MLRHPENLLYFCKFILSKIIPRIIVAFLLAALFAFLDRRTDVFEFTAFSLLFGFFVFYYLPPAIDTVYVLKKTGDEEKDDLLLLQLLKASKDSRDLIFAAEGGLVIKSSYELAVKCYEKLRENHDFSGWEVSRQTQSKQFFHTQYYDLLEKLSRKFLPGPGQEIKPYHLCDLEIPLQ
jgi:hypothetical protein